MSSASTMATYQNTGSSSMDQVVEMEKLKKIVEQRGDELKELLNKASSAFAHSFQIKSVRAM